MALIPGSYARAAGLQSEINKVTVTRVAGSEVQFRRTIDTYQRDLRYNINQIGREQRMLRRSLRRYSKKLQNSKKERKQRQAKAKEQSEKEKQNSEQFREDNQDLKRDVPFADLSLQDASSSLENRLDISYASDNVFDADQNQTVTSTLSDSPDSGVGAEMEETASPESTEAVQTDNTKSRRVRKAFLTSSKDKPPYLKAKRGNRNSRQEDERIQQGGESCSQDYVLVSTKLSDSEEKALLPSITEENEEATDQFKLMKTGSSENARNVQEHADNRAPNPDSSTDNPSVTSSVRTRAPVVVSLDTKSVSQSGKPCSVPAASITENTPDEAESDADNTENSGVDAAKWKKPRRKAGVSYGDLIKLQHSHTSSTKHLFELVDRLASVHGIVDPPPLPASSAAASLDPRNNVKIKRKSRPSSISDGMVKQAAVLYPMKYGYSTQDGQSEDGPSHDSEHPETSNDAADDQVKEQTVGHHRHASKNTRIPAIISNPSTHSTLSVRRDSTDVTSPFYEFSEAASSIFDDLVFEGASAPRRNKNKPLTLTELSVQATKIRERTLNGFQISQDRTEHMDDSSEKGTRKLESDVTQKVFKTEVHRTRRKSRVLSPVPGRPRALSRRRQNSVDDQLQRRLNEGGEAGQMAWHSAFGRLKMIHTLYDLSQHFTRKL